MIEILNRESISAELEDLRRRACGTCANAGDNACRYCGVSDERPVYWTEGKPEPAGPGVYEKKI